MRPREQESGLSSFLHSWIWGSRGSGVLTSSRPPLCPALGEPPSSWWKDGSPRHLCMGARQLFSGSVAIADVIRSPLHLPTRDAGGGMSCGGGRASGFGTWEEALSLNSRCLSRETLTLLQLWTCWAGRHPPHCSPLPDVLGAVWALRNRVP